MNVRRKQSRLAATPQYPLREIMPLARRQALQERVKTIPRYADANKYVTHAVLRIVEEQVSADTLPLFMLDSDDMIIGAIAWRAMERNLFAQKVEHEK